MTIIKSIISICFIGLATLLTAQNPTNINGSIAISDETIAALTTQQGPNWLTTGMGFEVWSVVYRDVTSKGGETMTRVYLNEKMVNNKVTTTIGAAASGKSINFTVNGIPQEGNFIVLYYFNNYPPQYKTFKVGSQLNDGTNRTGLHYAANAALKIGANKKYGAISILPVGQNQTYATTVYANIGLVAAFGWSDIVDFFEDLAGAVWAGGKSLAGVVVDAAGTILVQAYGMSQALIVDGYLPDYREITTDEYNWVNTKIFNGNLPAKSKIVITNLYGYGHRQFVFPTGTGIIMMNLGRQGFSNPFGKMLYQASANEKNGEVFIHEMTHVWQIHTAADINFVLKAIATQAGGSSAYNYNTQTCDNGKSWGSFNVEQQADIARHCYNFRETGNTSSCQQQLVVANIRRGAAYPIPRTPECVNLVAQAEQKLAALHNRANELKKQLDIDEDGKGSSGVFWPDGTRKVGSEKGTAQIQLSEATLLKDATYKRLRNELTALQQRKAAINCQ